MKPLAVALLQREESELSRDAHVDHAPRHTHDNSCRRFGGKVWKLIANVRNGSRDRHSYRKRFNTLCQHALALGHPDSVLFVKILE